MSKIRISETKNSENVQRFINGFKLLLGSKNPYQVWSDLMLMFATSLQNSCTRFYLESKNKTLINTWNAREEQYLKTIKQYSAKEQRIITQMFALLTMEYQDNPYQDLLGNIYMQLEIANKNAGQFFTPYNISQMSAKVTINKPMLSKQVHDKGYVSVNDPSVGAGGMLIAAAEVCSNLFKKLNYKNHVYFVGQDIDITCCHMSYIQISLLGLAGYIIHANTLTTPVVDYFKDNSLIWTTPYYNMDIWQGRILSHRLGMLMQERNVDNV